MGVDREMTISRWKLGSANILSLLLLPCLAAAFGQSAAPLRFEVATIKLREVSNTEPSNRQVLPGGRFVSTATTMQTLLRIAFGTDNDRIVGGPKWLAEDTYDINGVIADHVEPKTPEEFQGLLLSLLEERCGLKYHKEAKEGATYWLEMDKPGKVGSGLKASGPEATTPAMSVNSNGAVKTMRVSGLSMDGLAAGLRRQAGRPVENHTDLKGTFAFKLDWALEETPDSTAPSLFTALKDQLGLRLRPAKGTTEIVVIDQISRPSAN
jgi:uncharacterized protein (TIGR03435 family)